VHRGRFRGGRVTVAFGVIAAFVALLSTSTTRAATIGCHLTGDWRQTTAGQSSVWHISSDGQATESGLGTAHGTATLVGDVLTIQSFPSDPTFNGVYRWTLGPDCQGTGTLTFTNAPRAGQTLQSTVTGPPPTASTLLLRFAGYANDTRVAAPLVGAWQLGVARIHGTASVGGKASGSFTITFNASHGKGAGLAGTIIGGVVDGAKVTMRFRVVQAHPRCAAGTVATLTVVNSSATLSNGQSSDSVILSGWPNLPNCATFVMGWTNQDEQATTPTRGGPGGGEWASVTATPK